MLEDALLDMAKTQRHRTRPFLGRIDPHRCRKDRPTLPGVELDPLYVDLILRRYEQRQDGDGSRRHRGRHCELALRRQRDAENRTVLQSASENAPKLQSGAAR